MILQARQLRSIVKLMRHHGGAIDVTRDVRVSEKPGYTLDLPCAFAYG
jgi:hypothetical protein